MRRLVGSSALSKDDLSSLADFLTRDTAPRGETHCLLTELFGELGRRSIAPVAAIRFGATLVATAPASELRSAVLDYMQGAGARSEFYSQWVMREFSQENYTAFRLHEGELEAPAPPGNWREWEEQGWWRVEPDWPIAQLYFALKEAEDNINHRLRRLRSPLLPAWQTLEYFLLRHLSTATRTTPARVHALGDLVRQTSGVAGLEAINDRALLVFCRHWRLLPMAEWTRRAADAYLDLCDLEVQFAAGSAAGFPPLLEGLDFDHLERNWRQGAERWELAGLKPRK